MTEQIPLWAWAIGAMGSFSGLIYLVKYFFDKNREDWHEVKSAMRDLTENVGELVGIQKLHAHQIKDNSDDIKDLQRRLMSDPKVKYSK